MEQGAVGNTTLGQTGNSVTVAKIGLLSTVRVAAIGLLSTVRVATIGLLSTV
jgi:hypothetical protein